MQKKKKNYEIIRYISNKSYLKKEKEKKVEKEIVKSI